MTLSIQDVEKVARLARLRLNEADHQQYATQLSQILDYAAILETVETANVEPMVHAIELANVWREDEVKTSLPRQHALQNAPAQDGKHFVVPQILDAS
jgi:aspartyl-tRNA(Asn)/glutamyl-tRNA(Gln) amidotransferase subunit C